MDGFKTAYEEWAKANPVEAMKAMEQRTTEKTDSKSWGTDAKGGSHKVYFNSAKPKEAEEIIENYFKLSDQVDEERKKRGQL